MRRLLLLMSASLLVTPAAFAQQPLPEPAPAASGHVVLRSLSGLSDRGDAYVMKGQTITVEGRLRPYADGLVARVAIRRGKRVNRTRATVGRSRDVGRFIVRFKARRTGTYTVSARVGELQSKRLALRTVNPRAGLGSRGVKVRLLQNGLRRLGYAVPRGGHFGRGTARAVLAFRKTNSMARNGYASRRIYAKLFRGAGGFKLRYPKGGKHVEFDWSRQVLVLAQGGRVVAAYHASSGKASTPTVFGTFRFYRGQPGTNALGMVHSRYFIRGYAIHGYPSVPTFPASHGCIRVPIPNSRAIYDWINLGDRIFVYR
jgi:L,D-transpeptidase catalytic domain/Putative peptidoglycan binding domain